MKNKSKTRIIQKMLMGVLLLLFFSCQNSNNNVIAQETGRFTDPRDGKTYKMVKIGEQWIMTENFAYKPDQGNCWAYDNDTTNVTKYGYLYDWETAKKIAPEGWHLPSQKEWKTFRKSLGVRMDIWSTMKKVYKQMVDGGSSGFNAVFGGVYIAAYGEYRELGNVAYFWSSTLTSDGPTNYIVDREGGEAYLTNYANSKSGMSVRYFKD
jgi:uncharacterized protein (TIGR02145 family)